MKFYVCVSEALMHSSYSGPGGVHLDLFKGLLTDV